MAHYKYLLSFNACNIDSILCVLNIAMCDSNATSHLRHTESYSTEPLFPVLLRKCFFALLLIVINDVRSKRQCNVSKRTSTDTEIQGSKSSSQCNPW